jgi:predicted Zn-dependent protease
MRLIMAAAIAIVSLITYFSSQSTNPVTKETQHISMTPEQEIAMGLQAAPEVADEFGGLDQSQADQQRVKQIGQGIVDNSVAGTTPYEFNFHLLADAETVNAFALPGGQVFITRALYDRLPSDDELAGVLGHEIGHVVGRHSAEQIAKAQLTQGLSGAAVIAACDPNNPNGCVAASQITALVGQLINMRYGREDELESDWLGVCFMNDTGYNPEQLVRVMEVLESASGGQRQPEFLSTHPDPGNRIARIQENLQQMDQCPR